MSLKARLTRLERAVTQRKAGNMIVWNHSMGDDAARAEYERMHPDVQVVTVV